MTGSTTMLVLSLLNSGDKYGYQMIKELELLSDNTFTLNEGTLYPILHQLEKDGMVKSYITETDSGKKRKYYQLTNKGKKLLVQKKEEWALFTSKINQIIGGKLNACI